MNYKLQQVGTLEERPSQPESTNFFEKYCNEVVIEPSQCEETDQYLSEPCCKIKNNNDVLDYWKTNSQKFPHLSSMAIDILSIPAASAPIEAQFSSAGHLFSKRRNRMTPEMLETLVLLHDWSKNGTLFANDT